VRDLRIVVMGGQWLPWRTRGNRKKSVSTIVVVANRSGTFHKEFQGLTR
jgi:hypothetical protein